MKQVLYMEGFRNWPALATFMAQSTLTPLIQKYIPLIPNETRPWWVLAGYQSTSSSIQNTYTVDNIKYTGIVSSGTSYNRIDFNIPKTAKDTKIRYYFGARIAAPSFFVTNKMMALNGSGVLPVGPTSTAAASYYVEIVVDMGNSSVNVFVNKLLRYTATMSADTLTRITGGTATACIGNTNAYGSSPAPTGCVLTDLYVAKEEYEDGDTTLTPYGPVAVEFYPVSKVDASAFSTDAESKEAAVTGLYQGQVVQKDKPLFTDNNESVGAFSFQPVPDAVKPIAVAFSACVQRGASSGATLITSLTDGTTNKELAREIPPLSSATVVPVQSYIFQKTPFNDGELTPDEINKLKITMQSVETV